MKTNHNVIDAIIIEDNMEFSLGELSRACDVNAEWIIALVDEGILEPLDTSSKPWRFSGACLRRIQIIRRLQRDLGINLAGAALALQLLEEIDNLHVRITTLETSAVRDL